MTASLGTGKAKTQEDADNHAIQICANMDAECISMVVQNKAVLESRVNIPQEGQLMMVKKQTFDLKSEWFMMFEFHSIVPEINFVKYAVKRYWGVENAKEITSSACSSYR